MGKTKVVLDTNVLVSGLGWEGKPHKIWKSVVNGDIELFISQPLFEELSKVLDYPKFKFPLELKERFKSIISNVATFVETSIKLNIIDEDPADNRIIECAAITDADYIISGDRHLLSLGRYGKTRIVTPSEFLGIN